MTNPLGRAEALCLCEPKQKYLKRIILNYHRYYLKASNELFRTHCLVTCISHDDADDDDDDYGDDDDDDCGDNGDDDDDFGDVVGGVGKRCLALLMRWRHKNMGFAHTPAVSFDHAHLFHHFFLHFSSSFFCTRPRFPLIILIVFIIMMMWVL